jgi:hypothetical protein
VQLCVPLCAGRVQDGSGEGLSARHALGQALKGTDGQALIGAV